MNIINKFSRDTTNYISVKIPTMIICSKDQNKRDHR